MYTQCPQCLTVFQIDEDALQASFGIVQCGRCAKRFDALRTLSDTLPRAPNGPMGDGFPQRVPTLTEAVPPNALPPLEPGPPASGGGTDWFAEFETELTTSLVADTGPDGANGDHAWQVADVPVPSLLTAPEPPVVFGDFPTREEDLAEQAAWCESLEDAGVLVSGARDVAPPEPPAAADEDDGSPAAATVPEAAERLPAEAPVPPAAKEAGDVPAEPQEVAPPASASGAPARGDALPASLFLVQPAAEPEAAASPDTGETEGAAAEPSPAAAPAAVVSDPAEPLPPVYVRPRRRRTAGLAWSLGCLVLVVVLAAQVAWIERVQLFRDPATHAWTARACEVIACHLPPIRDVAKLELVSRDVRPDPRVPGALTITATLRNDAGFRQPWPVVVVELSDLDNNPVAMRRFRPAEYMPDAARRAAGIAPGATSAIAFEVADPGKRAVSFEFDFE